MSLTSILLIQIIIHLILTSFYLDFEIGNVRGKAPLYIFPQVIFMLYDYISVLDI